MDTKKRWWEGGESHGNPIKDMLAIKERIRQYGYDTAKMELHCTADYVFVSKRLLREVGWDIPVIAYRVSRKSPKCTYKTIRRDCAKRNRYK